MQFKNLKNEIEEIELDYYRERFSFNQYDDYYISRNKNLIHLFKKSIYFMEKNDKGIISIPYLNEDAFLKIMNTFIKYGIQIQNFQQFEAYFELNDEVIKKVYIQYQYKNLVQVDPNWDLYR